MYTNTLKVKSISVKKAAILFVIFFIAIQCYSAKSDTSKTEQNSITGLPFVFFTPETRWAAGIAGISTFKFKNEPDSSKASQFQLGFAYTQEKQLLSYLPFQLFLKNNKYWLYGELGYYIYTYQFYGVGNNARQSQAEIYGVTYPRIRINALQQLTPNIYTGFRYWFENFDVTEVEPNGLLSDNTVVGNNGGITSGLHVFALTVANSGVFGKNTYWL